MSALHQHRFSAKATIGALNVDAAFTLTAPWTVLFGPSGCGKTSILRMIGGTLPKAAVEFARREEGEAWVDLSSKPPDCRSLAYSPQAAHLFPHLDVEDNIDFPYSACSSPVKQASLVDESISLFSLHSLAERMPNDLSGGEHQRVSLARAFATPGARLMMLDEPFAGLDRTRRDALLPVMKQWCEEKGIQVLSVTHDVDEALLLAAEVIRMENGNIVAQGAAAQVLAPERERMLRVLSGIEVHSGE